MALRLGSTRDISHGFTVKKPKTRYTAGFFNVKITRMNYQEISPDFTTDFFNLVKEAKNIVITSHESPDEDSISSCLAIYHLLSTNYPDKKTRVIYSGFSDSRYSIFKNYDKIEFVDEITDSIGDADLLIMLDGANYSRFSKKVEKLQQIPKTICIDHHLSPTDEFTLSLIAPQYPSCSEVIYLSLFANQKIDTSLAEIFLLGILGDTGNFTYLKPQQTNTLLIAKKLLEIGQIEIQEFQSRYSTIPKRVFSLIQIFMKNTTYSTAKDWPDFQYSFLDREIMDENNYTDEEVTEASHLYSMDYIRKITGHTWGFVVTPNSNGDVNISCRSLPKSANVRIFMEKMGIGGGHDRASGGTFVKSNTPLDVTSCVNQTLDWIKSNTCVLG
jgi:nanoRNase/pAp phosphatase (c-di-AMP/oligoRNAs hydrolase)